jgi:hypothetical protein
MARTGFQCKVHYAPNSATAPAFPATGSPAPWALVAGVVTITLPNREVGEIDVTELAQVDANGAADPDMRYDPAPFRNPGEITFEAHVEPAAFVALDNQTGQPLWFRFSMPDPDGAGTETGLVGVGKGFLKTFGGAKAEKAEAVKATGVVKLSGKFVWTA